MKAVALVTLLSFAAYAADEPPKGTLIARDVTVELPGGRLVNLQGNRITGCWMDEGTCFDRARERIELMERVRLSEAAEVKVTARDVALPIVIALGVGFLVGGAAGVTVGLLTRPAQASQ